MFDQLSRFENKGLVNACSWTLLKYLKLSNYSLKILKFSISNALVTQTFIKIITLI